MFLKVKKLDEREKEICLKTISSKATFSLVADALVRNEGISIVRMGDGERKLLQAFDGEPFTAFETVRPGWNEHLGVEGLDIETIKANIIEAGNSCTYFAPSVSGVHQNEYRLYDHFRERKVYLDNFFVNDWTPQMVRMLLEESDGVYVMHREYDLLIKNFIRTYKIPAEKFSGFEKRNWKDNEEAIQAAGESGKQLVLFSAGPAGKIIAPHIAATGKVVLDVGNTLHGWSIGEMHQNSACGGSIN
ncbi:MAG: hypothetical protein A2408_01070 [Candidatus Yonathbacteria bacterium RIFOXYC1_FULL_52_10]|uniref:GT-D fold-like domain-containing protein n=1 Tax=Candidatus Yonathbacteria bacterium RIFOXYD1_FULL_52_36 TaxID=1802730 RepID=A0A1G2SNJ2_9BACT|nr:MAG: hypothetical protein A2408_01070 [Candidatus Yonathbacteria bacterium RIFOXYC1_FULL_52_10]OHA86382.1 MAG: hypothetical protein A2591_02695 [Candidatus Yonathbacteria bacterium RIFOXYD1_FULL_52_36]